MSTTDGITFGHELKEKHFLLGNVYVNMNHGSYGTVPRVVADRVSELFREQEARPDDWFRGSVFKYIQTAREQLAAVVNCDVGGLVLVENASAAVNSILRSMGLKRGQKVLRLSTAYGMVIETLDWLRQVADIEVLVVSVRFPMQDTSQIVRAVRAALAESPEISLAIFSHITSVPAVVMPVEELTRVVRDGCPTALVLIDGAHAPGQIKLDIPAIHADFYVGNCHKWMYAPKGTAFLWISPGQRLEHSPQPTVISCSGKHDIPGRFEYTGTRDYTAFAALPSSLSFIDYLGGFDSVYRYCHGLAIQGGRYLTELWGTQLIVPEKQTAFMVNIALPCNNEAAIKSMQQTLHKDHNVYLVFDVIFDESGEGRQQIFFTRLSAQVYVEMSDFELVGKLVLQILNNMEG